LINTYHTPLPTPPTRDPPPAVDLETTVTGRVPGLLKRRARSTDGRWFGRVNFKITDSYGAEVAEHVSVPVPPLQPRDAQHRVAAKCARLPELSAATCDDHLLRDCADQCDVWPEPVGLTTEREKHFWICGSGVVFRVNDAAAQVINPIGDLM
jgi:hypothetical protein